MSEALVPRRLNWGCGSWVEPGWVNSDLKSEDESVVACDIRKGLPFQDEAFEYAVAIHALPELAYWELIPALEELRRVIEVDGVLRLGLPDLSRGVAAYLRGDRDYFAIPDEDMESLGGKLVTQLVWYGYSHTLFVPDFVEELLKKAGFNEVHHVGFRQTRSTHPEIVSLDNREDESLFVEAVR
jgi:hypothetical protein